MRRWLVPLLLALCGALPLADAGDDFKDVHPNAGSGVLAPPPAAPAEAADQPEKTPPTLAYAFAAVAALIVLSILCVPSRKAESSTSR